MASKTPIHFNILACRDLATDSDWRDIIYSCACGKFPKGIRYNSTTATLFVRYEKQGKSQTESHILSGGAEDCYNILMYVFKNLLNLRSENDIVSSKQQLEDIRKQNDIELDCTWKQLKPKSMKNHILTEYAISLTEKHQLEPKNAIFLYKLIQRGFQFKNICPNNVVYKNGKIISITGLVFDEKSKTFKFTNTAPTVKSGVAGKDTNKVNHIEKSINKWVKEHKTIHAL